MIHKGKNTRSRIISKGISAGNSQNCYRGLVQVQSRADNARNSSQCDSMLIGDNAAANTYPYIQHNEEKIKEVMIKHAHMMDNTITWKYPSVVLEGDDTMGEFYSVALTNNYQQADTRTKMILRSFCVLHRLECYI
ncbi:hypothetical protein ACSBR1_042763 [Camellia fascicularis]